MTVLESNTFLADVVKFASSALLSYLAMKYLYQQLDAFHDERNKSVKETLEKLGIDSKKHKLSKHELFIASNLLIPDDINFTWADVAGLDHVKDEIFRTVIFPMKNRSLFRGSDLTRPPKGILLYGPPGCGKTLIAKATAKEAGVQFINLDISTLTDQYYGESSKRTTALFSLAEKIQPCIIFIDEIDSLLRNRSSKDHEATAQLKSIFMSKWDGLSTNKECDIIIMGATNRPDDIDSAIRRRMPKVFHISLPTKEQRKETLKLILDSEDHLLSNTQFDILAEKTEGFSNNDLQEICREASAKRLKELAAQSSVVETENQVKKLRKITMIDVLSVISSMIQMKELLDPTL